MDSAAPTTPFNPANESFAYGILEDPHGGEPALYVARVSDWERSRDTTHPITNVVLSDEHYEDEDEQLEQYMETLGDRTGLSLMRLDEQSFEVDPGFSREQVIELLDAEPNFQHDPDMSRFLLLVSEQGPQPATWRSAP